MRQIGKFTFMLVVYPVLIFLTALIIWDVFLHVLPAMLTQLTAVIIFVLAIAVLPILSFSQALKERSEDTPLRLWPSRNAGNNRLAYTFILFLVFSVAFCLLSVVNYDRFAIEQAGALHQLFAGYDASAAYDVGRHRTAAWLIGALPFLTTIVAIIALGLFEDDKKTTQAEIVR